MKRRGQRTRARGAIASAKSYSLLLLERCVADDVALKAKTGIFRLHWETECSRCDFS
jgi:hypothetical protein